MEYDGSSGEDEESDHDDITLLISSKSVPLVTVPAEDKDRSERVEDEDEDKDEDKNEAPPGLRTDESSSVGDKASAIGEMQQIQVEWRLGDQEDHNSWEPPMISSLKSISPLILGLKGSGSRYSTKLGI